MGKVFNTFSPPFLSLSFYFELGFYLSLQQQINSVFFAGLEVCVRSTESLFVRV